MAPIKIIALCTATDTVTSELSKDPHQAPGKVQDKLYSKENIEKLVKVHQDQKHLESGNTSANDEEPSQADLDLAAQCGQFGTRPSDLFLKIYWKVLQTIEADPQAGLVSPPLLGSSGVIPLSIISIIPDIVRHMADLIVHAEKEVFLATNYWEASTAAHTIVEALYELNKRIGERPNKEKVVIKLMYDRGSPKQVAQNHMIVPVATYTGDAVKLPAPDQIPNIDLEVMNFHRPIVGTFHAKYMVVDRKIAILNSNNIQDRVNMEMMTHLEGPIVDSFFDVALLSWNNPLTPPLPSLIARPPVQTQFDFGNEHKFIQMKDLDASKVNSRAFLKERQEEDKEAQKNDADENAEPAHTSGQAPTADGTAADANINAEAANVQRSLETVPVEGETVLLKTKSGRMAAITAHLNTNLQPNTLGNEPDNDDAEEFRPHILHKKHDLVPMALVNRRPHGTPGHNDTANPQDEAWLAGLKFAKHKVFIQTPTFNAPPVVKATLEAVRRGVECILYLDIGFNDEGELLPFQGGTNEMVVAKMYKELDDQHKRLLKVCWYTGKDQNRPINATAKKRNCHVKLMTIDDAVGIQGNGNQDSQSWFHSQEINVMVDSRPIVLEWQDGIRANQNTHLYGQVELDGVWRDAEGQPLKDASGPNQGPFSMFKGVKGAIARVRGEGGFAT